MSRLRVKTPNGETPPGGWVVRFPHEDRTRRNLNFHVLRALLEQHLLQYRDDPATASDLIHEHTAKQLIAEKRGHLVERIGDVDRDARGYISGATAIALKWWQESPIYGMLEGKAERKETIFVEQEEADRRAAICVECDHNVTPRSKNWAQRWSDKQMLQSVEGRKAAQFDRLAVCDVCSCELRAAVWWPADILVASSPSGLMRRAPDFCWKKKILSNQPT